MIVSASVSFRDDPLTARSPNRFRHEQWIASPFQKSSFTDVLFFELAQMARHEVASTKITEDMTVVVAADHG